MKLQFTKTANKFSKQFSKQGCSETGAFIVLVAGGIVAIMVLAWFATAVVGISRSRIRAQNAADAGAYGAMVFARDVRSTSIEGLAAALTNDNLTAKGISPLQQPSAQCEEFNGVHEYCPNINVSVEANSPVYLLSLIPGFQKIQKVKGLTSASAQTFAVTLVLDRSASLDNAEMAAVRQAANNFIGVLKEGVDYVSIIYFHYINEPYYPAPMNIQNYWTSGVSPAIDMNAPSPFPDRLTPLNKQFAQWFIDEPTHWHDRRPGTSTHDALKGAIRILTDPSILPSQDINLNKVIVLFTDGMPTTGSNNTAWPPNPLQDPGGPWLPNPCIVPFRTNSWNDIKENQDTEWFYLNSINWADKARLEQDPITVYTIGLGINAARTINPATGIPNPGLNENVLQDPFQNIMNDGAPLDDAPFGPLKSNFLARLANARHYKIVDTTSTNGFRIVETPDFVPWSLTQSPNTIDTTGCVRKFDDIGNLPKGEYFEAPTIAELDAAFQLVAKELRPRLSR